MRELEFYIHIPFCVRKCAYCDFLSFPAGETEKETYVQALLKEIHAFQITKDSCAVSVFFGGGTPSVLKEEQLERILQALRKICCFSDDAEITLECNPGTVTKEQLVNYRKIGINRLSIGLQSVHQEELQVLGRIHTYEQFQKTFQMARLAGFTNINVDLMSALPGQTVNKWKESLRTIAQLNPEHISAYSLIIEEGTPFYERYADEEEARRNGEKSTLLPSEEEEREMYACTEDVLGEFGYQRYEISNYAKPGKECRHNCGYWMRREYKGFGLGAASLLEKTRWTNTSDPKEYLAGNWFGTKEELSCQDEMEETMFLGLRMRDGVSKQRFQQLFGRSMEQVYGPIIEKLKKEELLAETKNSIYLTERGIDLSNCVMAEFLF